MLAQIQSGALQGGAVFLTTMPVGFAAGTPATLDGVTISVSGAGTGNNAPRVALEGFYGGEWQAAGVGSWWRIQFESYRRVTNIALSGASIQATDFSFQGSNDGSTWADLATGISNGATSPSVPISAPPYIYFRMISTAVTDITRMGLIHFTFAAN